MMNNEIKKIQRFTDLVVWQEGHKLVLTIYNIAKSFPKEERYGLADQMKRAAVSITSNIASPREKSQFYSTAKGSLTELQNQLLIAKDVGYLTKESFDTIAQQSVTTAKLLSGLLAATRQKRYEP